MTENDAKNPQADEVKEKYAGGRTARYNYTMTPGVPPKYDSPEQLQRAIEDYFTNGVKVKIVIIGKGAAKHEVEVEVPTITGLVLHLGFADRSSFYDYEKKEQFAYTIKRARTFIELEYEEQLQAGNTIGAIFALKNFGWIDKQNLDHTTAGKPITPQIIVFKGTE
jgi:hypothetical protein